MVSIYLSHIGHRCGFLIGSHIIDRGILPEVTGLLRTYGPASRGDHRFCALIDRRTFRNIDRNGSCLFVDLTRITSQRKAFHLRLGDSVLLHEVHVPLCLGEQRLTLFRCKCSISILYQQCHSLFHQRLGKVHACAIHICQRCLHSSSQHTVHTIQHEIIDRMIISCLRRSRLLSFHLRHHVVQPIHDAHKPRCLIQKVCGTERGAFP